MWPNSGAGYNTEILPITEVLDSLDFSEDDTHGLQNKNIA